MRHATRKLRAAVAGLTPVRVGAAAVYPYDPDLEAALAAYGRFDGEPLRISERLRTRSGDYLKVARALCYQRPRKDARTEGLPIEVASTIVPRDAEQARVMDQAAALLARGQSFQVRAGTGFGKTVVGCELIARVGRKALVIVPKEDLIYGREQWLESLQTFLGLRRGDIGVIQGSRVEVRGRKVVLAMLHTLARPGRVGRDLAQHFGLVIWDECHKIPAPTFSRSAFLFPAKLRLGLSATPERPDGKEVVTEAHIGPVRVSAEGVPMPPRVVVKKTPWVCPRRRDGTRIRHRAGQLGFITNHLAKHQARNALISRLCVRAYRAGRRTLVFSDRVKHLESLRLWCQGQGVPERDMALYISGLSEEAREEALGRRLIFCTYGMLDTGTNAPWLDACILATPRASVAQAVGRVLRKREGKKQPVVVDLVDLDSPVLTKFRDKRLWYYQKVRADVIRRDEE